MLENNGDQWDCFKYNLYASPCCETIRVRQVLQAITDPRNRSGQQIWHAKLQEASEVKTRDVTERRDEHYARNLARRSDTYWSFKEGRGTQPGCGCA